MTAVHTLARSGKTEPDIVSRKGHSTNLVGVPTGLLASDAFNRARLPLRIAGVRESNSGLFKMLDRVGSAGDAAETFAAYMEVVFGLHPEQRGPELRGGARRGGDSRRRYRSSYIRLIRGWAHDSNGPEGAVLKGWAESRFGLFPTYHKVPLRRFSSPAWMRYVEEKMCSRFHGNAIFGQLDLVYEFAQWSLARFQPEARCRRLYRGVNDFDEHPIVERLDPRTVIVTLNNLVSFSGERDIAGCFGSYILEADVPCSKIVFFNGLLAAAPLAGESEYLAIGGDYRVRASYY